MSLPASLMAAIQRLPDLINAMLQRGERYQGQAIIEPIYAKWLFDNFNNHNRTFRPQAEKYIQKKFDLGEWDEWHHNLIAFSPHGIENGQHRIKVISKQPQPIIANVQVGSRPGAKRDADDGLPRNLAARITISGSITPASNESCARIIRSWIECQTGRADRLNATEAESFFLEHSDAILFASRYAKHTRSIARAGVLVAAAEMFELNPVSAEMFMESLCVVDGDIQQARVLRDALLRSRTRGGGMAYIFSTRAVCVSAMSAYLEGRTVKQIKQRTDW